MQHANNIRLKMLADKKLERAKNDLAAERAKTSTVSRLLPQAASLIGRPGGAVDQRWRHKMTVADFQVLVRGCHLRSRVGVALGVKHARVICTAAKYALSRQQRGVRAVRMASRLALADVSVHEPTK